MLLFILAVAIINLCLGFGLAVYLGGKLGAEASEPADSANIPIPESADGEGFASETEVSFEEFAETLGIDDMVRPKPRSQPGSEDQVYPLPTPGPLATESAELPKAVTPPAGGVAGDMEAAVSAALEAIPLPDDG